MGRPHQGRLVLSLCPHPHPWPLPAGWPPTSSSSQGSWGFRWPQTYVPPPGARPACGQPLLLGSASSPFMRGLSHLSLHIPVALTLLWSPCLKEKPLDFLHQHLGPLIAHPCIGKLPEGPQHLCPGSAHLPSPTKATPPSRCVSVLSQLLDPGFL